MGANSGKDPDRRAASRYLVRLPVACHRAGEAVPGHLVDVSASGARIEARLSNFSAGDIIEVALWWFPIVEPPRLEAHLVREAEGGFAVHFREPDAFLRAMLDLVRHSRPDPGSVDPQRALRRAELLEKLNRL